jgi:hypothetical protein
VPCDSTYCHWRNVSSMKGSVAGSIHKSVRDFFSIYSLVFLGLGEKKLGQVMSKKFIKFLSLS